MMLRLLVALAFALSCSAAPAFDNAPVSTQIADAIADVIGVSDHPQRELKWSKKERSFKKKAKAWKKKAKAWKKKSRGWQKK